MYSIPRIACCFELDDLNYRMNCNRMIWKKKINSSYIFCKIVLSKIAGAALNRIHSFPKQKWRPLPFLLCLTFFYGSGAVWQYSRKSLGFERNEGLVIFYFEKVVFNLIFPAGDVSFSPLSSCNNKTACSAVQDSNVIHIMVLVFLKLELYERAFSPLTRTRNVQGLTYPSMTLGNAARKLLLGYYSYRY